MKLYFSPGACSLSPHVVFREAGLAVRAIKVDLKAKRTADRRDYTTINPKGYVPALELDDGSVLTEGPAIVQYLADKAPASGLVPQAGTIGRYRVQEWLHFVATELHKAFGPLFNPGLPAEIRQATVDRIATRIGWVAQQLEGRRYLIGDAFTVADAYLFTVLGWAGYAKIDLDRWPAIKAYVERVGARPKVKEAKAAEAA